MPIKGKPTDENIIKLIKECINAAASVPTSNRGGHHGHIGMLFEESEYIVFSNGNSQFTMPVNPGAYPATVNKNNAVIHEWQIAEHKASIAEFEMYLGVESFLRKKIVESVEPAWLTALKIKMIGFNTCTPKQLIDHLHAVGRDLDESNVMQLTKNLQKDWDMVEAPAQYFARGDKIECQLEQAGQTKNPTLHLAFAVTTFEASGEF